MEPTTGMIVAVGFLRAPLGWALCDGTLLQIANYPALYNLLGTAYGGDGIHTFGLPDLRGRTIVGSQGTPASANVNAIKLGQPTGVQSANVEVAYHPSITIEPYHLPNEAASGTVQINGMNLASTLYAINNGPGGTAPVDGAMLCASGTGPRTANIYYVNKTPGTPLPLVPLNSESVLTKISGTASFTSNPIGSATPIPMQVTAATTATVSVMQPSLALTYIICLAGNDPIEN